MERHHHVCARCGSALSASNRIGKCRRCYLAEASHDPVFIAVRRDGIARSMADPKRRARRMAGLLAASRNQLAWCPLEYRDTYRVLTRRKHLPAATARAAIEELIAADAARYARTGKLQQAERG